MTTPSASQTLPPGFSLLRTIDLRTDWRLMVWLNLAALALLIPAGWFFFSAGRWIRPAMRNDVAPDGPSPLLLQALLMLLSVVFFILLHELIHGLFFWRLIGERPLFGLRGLYAFAAAPGWYIPRNPYLWIGLSPLVLISLFGLLLVPLIPSPLLFAWLFGLVYNAAGAAGDIYFVLWLLTQRPDLYIEDAGDVVQVFAPAAPAPLQGAP